MKKKTVVITGSTRGIGFALAEEFLKSGHNVVINGLSPDKVADRVVELQKTSPDVTGTAGDVIDPQTHKQLFEIAVATYGKVDIWINNAGIAQPYKKFVEIDYQDLKKLIDINILGLMTGTKIAAENMIRQGFGKIFNMEGFGSDGRTMEKMTLYGSSKRAVNYFTKSVSKEYNDSSVQIGVLNPGMVRTDLINQSMGSMSPEELKSFRKVYRVLAEDADVVSKVLVGRMIKSSKNYDRISFLSKTKLIFKILKMLMKRS